MFVRGEKVVFQGDPTAVLTIGAVYTITDCWELPCGTCSCHGFQPLGYAVSIVEAEIPPSDDPAGGWCALAFRKIEPKSDLCERLMTMALSKRQPIGFPDPKHLKGPPSAPVRKPEREAASADITRIFNTKGAR